MIAAASRRVAVYGEIDPNLVDGSSVWLQSVCQVLGSIDGVEVTLLLRRPLQPERRFLLEELAAHGSVELVDSGEPALLGPAEALDLLEELERERGRFDLVLLRGQAVLAEAAERGAFDGRLWPYAMTGRGMPDETLRALAARSHRVLCQTEAVAEELRAIVPEANGSILILPPMIPDTGPAPERDGTAAPPARGEGARGPLRLAYSGKLSPEYCWLETVAAFEALRAAQPGAELHVLGDKVHRPPAQPDFHERAMRALRETEGLRWHGAVPRGAVPGLLADCDLALSIRDPGVEAAREISTKVLEYGAAGLPVVLNRAPAYEALLGEDYPLFIDGPGDAAAVLAGPALDPETRAAAAAACRAASEEFTFGRVAARLVEQLPPAPPRRQLRRRRLSPCRSKEKVLRAPPTAHRRTIRPPPASSSPATTSSSPPRSARRSPPPAPRSSRTSGATTPSTTKPPAAPPSSRGRRHPLRVVPRQRRLVQQEQAPGPAPGRPPAPGGGLDRPSRRASRSTTSTRSSSSPSTSRRGGRALRLGPRQAPRHPQRDRRASASAAPSATAPASTWRWSATSPSASASTAPSTSSSSCAAGSRASA